VFFNVSFRGFVGMVSHVNAVSSRSVGVVASLFVISSLVMLCCFVMMVSGVRTMFRRLSVVFGCFF
jgi:energy-converting hydrogenase Eha subunit C